MSDERDELIAERIAERDALRRVPGLSTELEDISEVEYRQVRLERVVLVGVWTTGTQVDADRSLVELARLAETAGSVVLAAVSQRRQAPDAATYIGSGKARELRDLVADVGADTVICDGELTPGQLRQLESVVKVKVVDRTWLILDIFAQHARSNEGKAQVALAQMQYMLPRLRGWGEALSNQGAGIGTRGPGETKIETDRRRIRAQITRLRRQLVKLEKVRVSKAAARRASTIPSVAIVGYTNAGKSSLLNRLSGAGLFVDDALFATVDTTVRRAKTPSGRQFMMVDTVGFVRHLPHELVEAFRSTLEESARADLQLLVLDATDPDPLGQLQAVREVLKELPTVPEIIVVNKSDAADAWALSDLLRQLPGAVAVSARTGDGVADLIDVLDARLPRPTQAIDSVIPYAHAEVVALVHRLGADVAVEHTDEGTRVRADVPESVAARVRDVELARELAE